MRTSILHQVTPAGLLALCLAACSGDDGGPAIPGRGAVTGSVVDEATAPMAGVALAMTRPGSMAQEATSAGNGTFTFTSLEVGTWALAFTPPEGFQGAAQQQNPVSVTVQADVTTTVPPIQLMAVPLPPNTGGITATATLNGTAASGIAVAVLAAGGDSVLHQSATGTSGSVTFAGLEPGSYGVRVTLGVGQSLAQGETQSKTVAVNAGAFAPVSFALTQPVVTIQLLTESFSPDSVQVAAGTIVRWVNTEAILHTITPENSSQDGVWERRTMGAQNEVFEHIFTVSGQTYRYRCEPHSSPFPNAQGMVGVIVVQ
jgi:plastocyanin